MYMTIRSMKKSVHSNLKFIKNRCCSICYLYFTHKTSSSIFSVFSNSRVSLLLKNKYQIHIYREICSDLVWFTLSICNIYTCMCIFDFTLWGRTSRPWSAQTSRSGPACLHLLSLCPSVSEKKQMELIYISWFKPKIYICKPLVHKSIFCLNCM